MEKIYYELKPFICLALSIVGLRLGSTLPFGKFFAVVLLFCTALIIFGRLKHRGYLK